MRMKNKIKTMVVYSCSIVYLSQCEISLNNRTILCLLNWNVATSSQQKLMFEWLIMSMLGSFTSRCWRSDWGQNRITNYQVKMRKAIDDVCKLWTKKWHKNRKHFDVNLRMQRIKCVMWKRDTHLIRWCMMPNVHSARLPLHSHNTQTNKKSTLTATLWYKIVQTRGNISTIHSRHIK